MQVDVESRAARWVTTLLLLATALVGLAHIAFLPPFEGFDETAHWSYVQELADVGRPPRYGVDGLSRDTDRYPGPLPYGGGPPFDHTGRLNYRGYRRAGAPALAGGPTTYAGNAADNWQAQHPPLYYAMLTPLYRLTHGWGWISQLFALRLASFALAYLGFAAGVLTIARMSERFGVWAGPIAAAWPFLFPQFFPEFARLGNDSLCLLCMGAAWAALARLLTGRGAWLSALGLGLALGCGLLAKAFFLPIGASVGLLLFAGWWSGGRRAPALGHAALAGGVAVAIGGWWYVERRIQTGAFTGSDEFIRFSRAGGLRLIGDSFSAGEFIHGMLALPATFLWAGTWSLARLPEIWLAAPALLLLVGVGDYLRVLAQRRAELLAWAPLALAVPMLLGLVYHVFVWMAGTSAETPGWYLHILAAPLGLAVALGWRRPRILTVLTGLTALYTALAWAWQLSLFSGCAAKMGADKHYSLMGAGCFIDGHVLRQLAHPALGAVALATGAGCALAAAALAWRAFRPSAPAAPTPLQPAAGLQPL
jgi:hypothetical protein